MKPNIHIADTNFSAVDALFFTPNPCIERTLSVEEFARGQGHRVASENLRVTAGGKGINAARVAQKFGASVRVLAPVGTGQIAQFRALLQADRLEADLIEVEADTRTATNIVHADGYTELVEAGNPLSIPNGGEILNRFGKHLQTCKVAVIGGSYPPSAPNIDWSLHATMMCESAAGAGKRVLYDGKGEPFARALKSDAPPWAIKPNLVEASELLDRDLTAPDAQQRAVRELMQMGVEIVLLSCGARGLWLGYEGQIEWLVAPKIEEVSPVGSGDSLVGAFVAHWLQSGDVYQAARWGVAAGGANAAQWEAARIEVSDAAHLMS